MKDWQVFHSQGWHTTSSAEPNLIFTPHSFYHSQLHLCHTRSLPFISFFIIIAVIHQAASLSCNFKIFKAAYNTYWHFLFFKTIHPCGCGISHWPEINFKWRLLCHLFLNVNNGTIFTSSTYHLSSAHRLRCLDFKAFWDICTPCPHFLTLLFSKALM